MRTKDRIIIQYFLRVLQIVMQSNDILSEINPVWLKFCSKEELRKIVEWLHLQKIPEGMDLDNMDGQDLLDAIDDEYLILQYFIAKLTEELEAAVNPDDESVLQTMKQLGMETHYLVTKPVGHWDKYDFANYKGLSVRAGNPVPFYGIFNTEVKEEEKYFANPVELHGTEWEAQSALFFLCYNNLAEGEKLKIMII